jgi:hypothetical protein
MQLGLREEDLFTLLLHHGSFHCLMEVATLKIAEKLYLTPLELVHWHESGLLGSTKPADQLVANTGKPSNGLKVILDALVKVCLCTICVVRVLLVHWSDLHPKNTDPSGKTTLDSWTSLQGVHT